MRGSYEGDPFAYGQVQLGGQQAPSGQDAEDILFQGGAAPPLAHNGFGMPMGRTLDESPLISNADAFGTEILGETVFDPQPAAPRQVAQPVPERGTPVLPPVSALTQRPESAVPAEKPAAPRPPAREVPVAAERLIVRRSRGGPLGSVVPAVVLAAGCGAGAWLHLAQDNVVLAGLALALGLVGAVFSWIWLNG